MAKNKVYCIEGFGKRLASVIYSDEHNYTVREIGKKIGCSRTSIYGWIAEDYVPNATYLAKLSALLDIDLNWLMVGKEKNGRKNNE